MKRLIFCMLCMFCISAVSATHYVGRIVDERGQGIGYATVYPEQDPVVGAATNDDGYFTIDTDLPAESPLIISFIGYRSPRATDSLGRNRRGCQSLQTAQQTQADGCPAPLRLCADGA